MRIPKTARIVTQMGMQWVFLRYHGSLRRDPTASVFAKRGRGDPYRDYDRIRAEGPLARTATGAYATADHAVAQAVLRNRRCSVDSGIEPVVDLSLLGVDPPDHTRLRRLVSGAFAPGRLRTQEQRISAAVDRLADDLVAQLKDGPVDLIETFAKPVPIFMIASLLGIPDADLETLGRHGDAVGQVVDGPQSVPELRAAISARRELDRLFAHLVDLRRREPGEDVVSDLVAAHDRGQLSLEELHSLCSLLLVAGFETTINLIGNAVAALVERPVVWRRLVESPELADTVLEETLRWESPVQATVRVAEADIELAGTVVRRGSQIVVLLGGANRDPRVFDRPEAFDIDRPNAHEHLSFGHGIHHCLGRPLAMLESRLALQALARRLPDLAPAGPAVMSRSSVLRGPACLPVRA